MVSPIFTDASASNGSERAIDGHATYARVPGPQGHGQPAGCVGSPAEREHGDISAVV
nr:hypothetical protein [Candidatus Sigynarchaeota archaeon]